MELIQTFLEHLHTWNLPKEHGEGTPLRFFLLVDAPTRNRGFDSIPANTIETLIGTLNASTDHILLAFDGDHSDLSRELGDPRYDDAYDDCRGFNKAFTLQNLIRAGEEHASSLQAHLLNQGIFARNFNLRYNASLECLKNWISLPPQPLSVQVDALQARGYCESTLFLSNS